MKALALALLPAAANFAGALLAENFAISDRAFGLTLHLAAGIVLAVVAVELVPDALDVQSPWITISAFVAGGVFFLVLDMVVNLVANLAAPVADGGTSEPRPWPLFFGVAIDLFSDGVMIGTASSIALGLGLLLALAQTPADIPEGFATTASFKRYGIPRRSRILLAAALALPILIGTTTGYWVVRGQPQILKLSLLMFTAGVLTALVVEEIIPQGHREDETRLAALLFVAGFGIFAFLSAYSR